MGLDEATESLYDESFDPERLALQHEDERPLAGGDSTDATVPAGTVYACALALILRCKRRLQTDWTRAKALSAWPS